MPKYSLYALFISLFIFIGCSAATPNEDPIIYGADDNVTESTDGVSGSISVGSVLKTTTDVNFRTGPGTSHSVIRVLAKGTQVMSINQTQPTNLFYNVKQQGTTGWVHGNYLQLVSSNVVDNSGSATTAETDIIDRAKASVGFSYWWGHGRWLSNGPTSSTAGACSGSCPSCSHSGSYGADCSGMVAQAWQVGGNKNISVDSHPYSTSSFVNDSSEWNTVSRSSLKIADALVYNSGGSGHIVLYESGDGWGSMNVFECKGCSYGCVFDLRSLSSSYHGIRKTGL